MYRGKEVGQSFEFVKEQSIIFFRDRPADDRIEGFAVTIFDHQQTVEIFIAAQGSGNIVGFSGQSAEFIDIVKFPVHFTFGTFPIRFTGGEEFADHFDIAGAVFIDVNGVRGFAGKNPEALCTGTADLRHDIIFEKVVKRIARW